jgi:hypothetical protein
MQFMVQGAWGVFPAQSTQGGGRRKVRYRNAGEQMKMRVT